MALVSVDYFSSSLMRTTTVEIILPFDDPGDAMAIDAAASRDPRALDTDPYPRRRGPFKTLVFLHGILGNHTDLISETRIRHWAEERGIAVVMPSGYNAFYLDQPDTHNYYARFVGRELLQVARSMLPLSPHREDTFIGGISMGAYGALRNGLANCELFGGIVALSCAMVAGSPEQMVRDDPFFLRRPFLGSTFGDLGSVRGGDKDPVRLAADLVYCDRPRPRVLLACGEQDPLLDPNRYLAHELRGKGLDVDYREAPGGHDWDFWNAQLPGALDWI